MLLWLPEVLSHLPKNKYFTINQVLNKNLSRLIPYKEGLKFATQFHLYLILFFRKPIKKRRKLGQAFGTHLYLLLSQLSGPCFHKLYPEGTFDSLLAECDWNWLF
jgi:hypothetical protein